MIYEEWIEWRANFFKKNKNFNSSNMTPQETEKLKSNCKNLLGDIIIKAQEDDEANKIAAIKAGKGSQAIGESWMVFHLKVLEKHLNEIL